MYKFKEGQMVKYVGYKRNVWGDTKEAQLKGKLIVGKEYKIVRIRDRNLVGDAESVTLDVRVLGEWSLHAECVAPITRRKSNLPSWF